jgi:predicted nuclease of predicted toxin-antitoxin system
MRFKIDENLPVEVATILRLAAHDAETVAQEGLSGDLDEKLSGICQREERIVITLDLGFGDIRAYPPVSHPGIVILRPARQDKHSLIRLAERLVLMLREQAPKGQLWIVDEARVRIRW